ncbi:portal protein [Natronospirillum operosum]|uniref:Portal protein n=1 Tax=Natronospirillum operosum TaxID=2759953 RepID=A0A4Z0WIV7_9GAMM|nr:monovalent cation/H+ antiporter complex subunit F [Natronospirillum operosum]TGG95766.1 portal protein [Natronospirillum operosum]
MTLLASVLLLTILAGLWRILRGPTSADRLLAMQLFGTTGAAFLLVLAFATDSPALIDAALVLALLAAVASAALVQYLRPRRRAARATDSTDGEQSR